MIFRTILFLLLVTLHAPIFAVELGTEERLCALHFSRANLRNLDSKLKTLLAHYKRCLIWNRDEYHDDKRALRERISLRTAHLNALRKTYEAKRKQWDEQAILTLWLPRGISFDDPGYANNPNPVSAMKRWVNSLLTPTTKWQTVVLTGRSAYKHIFMQKTLGKTADIGQYALIYLWIKIHGTKGKADLVRTLSNYEPKDRSRGYDTYHYESEIPITSSIDAAVGQRWGDVFPGLVTGDWSEEKQEGLANLTELAIDQLFDDVGFNFRPADLPLDERSEGWRRSPLLTE